jgi:hypothetical protein
MRCWTGTAIVSVVQCPGHHAYCGWWPISRIMSPQAASSRSIRCLSACGFLQPAQMDPVRRAIAHHEADQLAIELEARIEVAHREDKVARARDVERRGEIRRGDRHRGMIG